MNDIYAPIKTAIVDNVSGQVVEVVASRRYARKRRREIVDETKRSVHEFTLARA